MYLLDTDTCIEFLRGNLAFGRTALEQSDSRLFGIPAIVRAELLLGAAKSNRAQENRLIVESFLLPFETIPFDGSCAEAYARIRADLESSGRCIGPNDLFIAATAVARSAVLVTNNVRELSRVEGLSLESWAGTEL